MYSILLLIHLLAATVWTGGHLVLALRILPRALREKSVDRLKQFESAYEVIGIPALLLQVGTGLTLAFQRIPSAAEWLSFNDCESRLIGTKLTLLALTAVFGVHARLRLIPNLSERSLPVLAWHIAAVTSLAVLFVVAGWALRTGALC